MTPPADDFALRDQFDRPHPVRFADARLTLLVFSGRATAADGEAWGQAAAGGFGDAPAPRPAGPGRAAPPVRVVAVAAMGGVPGFVRPVVRQLFHDRPPLALDWDDAVAARFGYRPGAARAVLVDAAGRVRAAADGPPTPAALADFAAATRA